MSTQEITLQVVARTFYRNYVEIQAITITTIIFTHTHTHTHKISKRTPYNKNEQR